MKYEDWFTEEVLKELLEATLTPDQGKTSTRKGPYGTAVSIYGDDIDPLRPRSPSDAGDEAETDDLLLGKKLEEKDEEASKNVKMEKAQEFVQYLPKYTPTEAWGDPNSQDRKQVEKIFNSIGGDATIQAKIEFINDTIDNPTGRITGTRRILGVLILLESLAAVIRSFNEASAGFVFEGFLAALLRGKQVAARTEKGNLPIEDLIIFSQLPGKEGGTPVSLKLLSQGTVIEGSYTNLVDALFQDYRDDGMAYLVARKDGSQMSLELFHLEVENFLPAIALDHPSGEVKDGARKLLQQGTPDSAGFKSAEETVAAYEAAKTDQEKYDILQDTNGYSSKGDAEQAPADPSKSKFKDKDYAFENPKKWGGNSKRGKRKFAEFFVEEMGLSPEGQLFQRWSEDHRAMESTFLKVIRGLANRFGDFSLEDTAISEMMKWINAAAKGKSSSSYLGTKTGKGAYSADYVGGIPGKTLDDKSDALRAAETDPNAMVDMFFDAIVAAEGKKALQEWKRNPFTLAENRKLLEDNRLHEGVLVESKTQWGITAAQLPRIPNIDYEVLGTLPYADNAVVEVAAEYMSQLEGNLEGLFKSITALSDNVNSYFFTEKRSQAVPKGETAIKDANRASYRLGKEVSAEKTDSE